MKKKIFLFFILPLLSLFVPFAWAEDSLLKIQVLLDQNSVKVGMMFLAQAQVVNSSPDTATGFWSNSCSYEKHWVTDNPEILIQPWTCDENSLEEINLEPGDIYEKKIILYVPKKKKTESMTFRLGFKRMSEAGDVAEPLWSDPLTMQVVVPEEMAGEVSEKEDNKNPVAMEAEKGEPQDALPELAVPEVSQALVFQDPSIPIKIKLGEEFSISLVSNPSTGFRWKMTLPEDDKIVMFAGSEHVASKEVMPGVPGHEVFKFKALSVGATNASFVYERVWETRTASTRKVFTILVQEE